MHLGRTVPNEAADKLRGVGKPQGFSPGVVLIRCCAVLRAAQTADTYPPPRSFELDLLSRKVLSFSDGPAQLLDMQALRKM